MTHPDPNPREELVARVIYEHTCATIGLNARADYDELSTDTHDTMISRARAILAALDKNDHEVLRALLVSLVAAVSLLKSGSKKAAPSDKMFDQMIADYEKSIERARELFSVRLPAPPAVAGETT